MSAIYIVSAIVALLTVLICYVFISQHLAKKRKQRRRLMAALIKRQTLFKHMADGLPAGFLPTELNTLIYRVLLSTCDQLAKLDPKAGYHDQYQHYSQQMESANQVTDRVKLETPQQNQEARTLLQELMRYVQAQMEQRNLPQAQGAGYLSQIRRLVLQTTLEAYNQQAQQAKQEGKLRLAIHYYDLARKLLLKEANQQNVQKQISQLSNIINKLEEQYAAENAAPTPQSEEEEATQKAWEQFDEQENWKKKQLYD